MYSRVIMFNWFKKDKPQPAKPTTIRNTLNYKKLLKCPAWNPAIICIQKPVDVNPHKRE